MQFANAFSIEFDEVVHLVGGGSNSLSRSISLSYIRHLVLLLPM